MERAQHRMPRNRTRGDGNRHNPEWRLTGKFISDSYSDNHAAAKEAMDMFEMGKSSSKRVNGAPMRDFLAEEMSKEMGRKRRSPSIIARLMGLDALPSPRHGHGRQIRLPGNHHQISGSIDVQRDSHLLDGRSSVGSSRSHQEFKDVYEYLEASHVVNQRYSSRWSSNSKLKEPEVSFDLQKLLDAKRHYASEKRHASTKFNDSLGSIDSNRELLLKFLQKPDSLFVKHVNDLQLDPSNSPCNHIAILKPSNSAKYVGNAKVWNSERICACKHGDNSYRKRKDGLLLHSLTHHTAPKTVKSSNGQSEEEVVKHNLPTQIVVLKPGKTSNAKSSALSFDHSNVYMPGHWKQMKYPSLETVEAGSQGKRGPSNFVGLSRPKSREAKEVAKKITTRMRENFVAFDRGFINRTHSEARGYTGDESSYDTCDSNSDSASDMVTVTSRKSFGQNSQVKARSSITESSMNNEAKKRMSQRWKKSHRYRGEEICVNSSTLAEMLALPDNERMFEHLDAVRGWDGANDYLASSGMNANWDGPLGISSRDRWKDGCFKKSTRVTSLPPSCGGKSLKASEQQDAHGDEKYLVNRETVNWGTRKDVKGNSNRKEGSLDKGLGSGGKRHNSYLEKFVVDSDSSPNTIFRQTETKIHIDKVKQHEQLLASPRPTSAMEPLPDLSSSTSKSGSASVCDQQHSILQEASAVLFEEGSAQSPCHGPETESSESSKEADRPSPVSVLEVGSMEDTSSDPGCLERVSAELQELRMQLQLLKMESEVDTNVSMLLTSDEHVLSQAVDKHKLRAGSWEERYIVDVLLESGLEEPNPEMFIAPWPYPEFPLDASLFDNLEKKYGDGTAALKSERRLLFDRINSALVEVFQQYMDTCPRVNPAIRRVDSIWQKHGLKDAVNNILADQENSSGGATRMLESEMEWLGYRKDIDMMGKQIEKLLTDELIMEVVSM